MKSKANDKDRNKRSSKPAPKPSKPAARSASDTKKSIAKSKGLDTVEELLTRGAGAVAASKGAKAVKDSKDQRHAKPGATTGRVGALAAAAAAAASASTAVKVETVSPQSRVSVATTLPSADASRFERSVARAEKGEPGPIKVLDLVLDQEAVEHARQHGLVDTYKRILRDNPAAQPGRPLVNVLGSSDKDLKFQLLSLHELVLAAKELGRDVVQVSLVRLSAEEAKALLKRPPAPEPVTIVEAAKTLSAREIAATNGFLEIAIKDVQRDENLRQSIDTASHEFHNLVESIRSIGLQNPPVVEVRDGDHPDRPLLVCVSGHRRLLALEVLEVQRVTCALKTFKTDRQRTLAGLAENINREDLHFLDKADGYGLLIQQGMTTNEIAALLDADNRTVGKYVRASSWDLGVKERVREYGSRMTTRFLLNMMAAGERTTPELHDMVDRFVNGGSSPSSKLPRGAELKNKLGEFYSLSACSHEQRMIVEKALKFLGYLR